ncbi:MAG: oligosaccharide flippase family protein [Anaerolineae bacterium]|nr:oligosaccharide flippase family protein [Anaerolineae bacterium]
MIKTLLQKFLTYGIGNIFQTALSFVLLPLYLQVFSPDEFGVISVLTVILGLLNLFTGGGMMNGLIRLYYETEGRERKELVGAAWLWYLAVASVGGVILLAQASLFSFLLFHTASYVTSFRLLGLIFFFMMLRQVPFNLVRLEKKANLYVSFSLFNFLTDFILKLYFIVYLERGVSGFFESGIISNFLTLAVMLPFTLNQARFTLNISYLKQLLRLGGPFVFSGLAAWTLEVSDRLLLGRFSGEAAVGIYALAYNFANIFGILLATPVALLMDPFFFAQAATRSTDDTKRLLRRTFIYFVLAGGVVYLAITLGSGELLRAFTTHFGARGDYLEAIKLIPILTLAPFLYFISSQASLAGLQAKKPEIASMVMVIAAGVNVGLNFFIIPVWGTFGAAMTTLLAYLLVFVLLYFWVGKIYPVGYDWKAAGGAFIYLAIALAIGWLIRLEPPLLSLLVKVLTSIAVFILLSLLSSGILTSYERDILFTYLLNSKRKLVTMWPRF